MRTARSGVRPTGESGAGRRSAAADREHGTTAPVMLAAVSSGNRTS
ncbi:hypothetical protein VB779_18865 [Haloarculaceae archaeon H-GB11]|nr:hypothetical protein [Haloarculaceae archaeon H-GB11]